MDEDYSACDDEDSPGFYYVDYVGRVGCRENYERLNMEGIELAWWGCSLAVRTEGLV